MISFYEFRIRRQARRFARKTLLPLLENWIKREINKMIYEELGEIDSGLNAKEKE